MEPTDDPANYLYGIFYINKNDSRIMVPRALGWTLNFAWRWSYVITGAFIFAMILLIALAILKII